MRITVNRKGGWTVLEIMIAVTLIGMLAGISVPGFMKVRDTASLSAIKSNLRLIDDVKQQWGLETMASPSSTPAEADLLPYLKGNAMPVSIIGEVYSINALDEPATATIPFSFGGLPGGTVLTHQ